MVIVLLKFMFFGSTKFNLHLPIYLSYVKKVIFEYAAKLFAMVWNLLTFCLDKVLYYGLIMKVLTNFIYSQCLLFTSRNFGVFEIKIWPFNSIDDFFECTAQNSSKYYYQINYKLFLWNSDHFNTFHSTDGNLISIRKFIHKKLVHIKPTPNTM